MKKLKVGDIISSPEFAMGITTECLFLNEIVPATSIDAEIGSYNKSRGTSLFVVEQITMSGGNTRESIPDQPFIIARKLRKDKKYNPSGELISFFYPSEFLSFPIREVKIEGHMERLFV